MPGIPIVVVDTRVDACARRDAAGGQTQLHVPAEFLSPGSYKTEVLAIDDGGNQTLTEVAFTVT